MAGQITCTPLPEQGGMRLFADWTAAAHPGAHLKVERLVEGQADTAVRPAYAPVEPAANSGPTHTYSDTFERTVASSWGIPDAGPAWINTGTAAAFNVNGTQGEHLHPLLNTNLISELPVSIADWNDLTLQIGTNVGPVGGNFNKAIRLRSVDANNYLEVAVTIGGNVDYVIRQVAAGVTTTTTAFNMFGVYPTTQIPTRLNVRIRAVGTFFGLKIWKSVVPEPAAWNATMTVTHTAAGRLQLRSNLSPTVNSSLLPVGLQWDDLAIGPSTAPAQSLYHVTTCSQLYLWDYEAPMDVAVRYRVTDEPHGESVTSAPCVLNSGGHPWLIDPLSPCRNIKLASCKTVCPPPDAVMWIGHEQESYTAVSAQFEVIGKRRPVDISQLRHDAITVLHFASITCAARDKLLALTEPGTPLLLPAFDAVCWPGRYLALGDHAVIPLSRDLRRTERLHTVPAVVVDAPAGQTCCVSGTSWCDLCSCADTWDQLDAMGLSGRDVLEGKAVEGVAC